MDIKFPHLGITLKNVKDGFTLFGLDIKFYGVIIALGFLMAFIVVSKEAVRTGQNDEDYLDFLLWLVIPAILGARLYYVLFSLDDYVGHGKNFGESVKAIFNIRNGGLAIYGGVIAGIIVAIIFCKKRKMKFPLMADTVAMGLLIGQIMGRWGNFFNREAFGDYTDSLFAMCIPTNYFSTHGTDAITQKIAENTVEYGGQMWISVHPTFLYESLWNLALLIIIIIYRKHKKFDGEIGLMYLWGYGLGRVWIEGLRTDSLMVPGMGIRVSQLLAAACVLVASILLVKFRFKAVGHDDKKEVTTTKKEKAESNKEKPVSKKEASSDKKEKVKK